MPEDIMAPAVSMPSMALMRSSTWSAVVTASSMVLSSGMAMVRFRLGISISGMKMKPFATEK